MTAEELAEGSRERFKELEHKDWDWSSFYNGWLEGRADMLVSTDLEADLIKAGNRIQILEAKNAQLNADSFHHAKRLLKLSDAKKQIKELEHHMKCNTCGDYFDMRNLSRVAFHESCDNAAPYKQGQALNQ